jgi:hypothetical protein
MNPEQYMHLVETEMINVFGELPPTGFEYQDFSPYRKFEGNAAKVGWKSVLTLPNGGLTLPGSDTSQRGVVRRVSWGIERSVLVGHTPNKGENLLASPCLQDIRDPYVQGFLRVQGFAYSGDINTSDEEVDFREYRTNTGDFTGGIEDFICCVSSSVMYPELKKDIGALIDTSGMPKDFMRIEKKVPLICKFCAEAK